jgi:hypothetical protein
MGGFIYKYCRPGIYSEADVGKHLANSANPGPSAFEIIYHLLGVDSSESVDSKQLVALAVLGIIHIMLFLGQASKIRIIGIQSY